MELYDKLYQDVPYIVTKGNEQTKILMDLKNVVRLNLALAHLKLRNWDRSIALCEEVLKECPSNEKALFRLGEVSFVNYLIF